ncbi:hypothetical protein AVEN_67845-1, partial [Araneus ventricosus]
MGPVARFKIIRSGRRPSRWCGVEFGGEGVAAQVSSSSPDQVPKLQGSVPTALVFASKQ